MSFKNRIVKSGMANVDEILFNPANWRIHPKVQQEALKGILEAVGWVQQVIINITTGNLVDGHLRVLLAAREGEKFIPAVWVELTQEEENLILASLDPLSAMASDDRGKLAELLKGLDIYQETNIRELLKGIALEHNIDKLTSDKGGGLDLIEVTLTEPSHVVAQYSTWKLDGHILVCCSPVTEVEMWLPHLKAGMYFVPYASPTTLLSEKAQYRSVLALNPNAYICGHILDRYAEYHGADHVVLFA